MNEQQLDGNQQPTSVMPPMTEVAEAESDTPAQSNPPLVSEASVPASAEMPKVEPVPVQFVGPKTPSTFGPPLTEVHNKEEVKLAQSDANEGSGTKPGFSLKRLFRLTGD